MKSPNTMRYWLCLLLGLFTCAHALTFDIKPVKLSAEQRASLKRFLTDSSPALSFDWNSLEAHAHSTGRERRSLSVSMSTTPALTAAGVCRREQHHFSVEAATSKARWHANDELTRLQAWTPQSGDCSQASSPIGVDKPLSDAEFLFIERERHALRSRAAQVIGGSDCARVRYCEVTLRRIERVRQEIPTGKSRILTKLTFSPLKPGPACLYVMEVSFVGPVNELMPLGANCPTP